MSNDKPQIQLPLNARKCSHLNETAPAAASRTRIAALTSYPRKSAPAALERVAALESDYERSHLAALAFIPMTDLETLRAAGICYPTTLNGWRWLFRHRHERGLEDAFRRIGRRIVVDPERYRELVRARPAG